MRQLRVAVALLLLALSPVLFAGPGGKSDKSLSKDAKAGANAAPHVTAKIPFVEPAAEEAAPTDDPVPPPKGARPKGMPKPGPAAQGFLVDTTGARAASGRVPRGYGALNLTQPQKERIYGIQAVYDLKVKELEALIDRLKAEEAVQIENTLTPPQRMALGRYKAGQAAK